MSIRRVSMNRYVGYALPTFALCLLISAPAYSAKRTFVSTSGVDNLACSIAAPCRQFSAAVSATDSQGEVIALDSGGFGPVTITKSVSIIAAPGVYAGISVPSGGTGVLIATVGVKVVLRGLTINSMAGGFYGVRMTAGSELFIENCVISNFLSSAGGNGINVQAPAKVTISGSVIRDNFGGVTAGSGSTVTIVNSQVLANSDTGIRVGGGADVDVTQMAISDTVVTGSTSCIVNNAKGGSVGHINASRVTVTGCYYGIRNQADNFLDSSVTVAYSMVSGSHIAFSGINSATNFEVIYSLKNNLAYDNDIAEDPVDSVIGIKAW